MHGRRRRDRVRYNSNANNLYDHDDLSTTAAYVQARDLEIEHAQYVS